jgi:adenylate cyclase
VVASIAWRYADASRERQKIRKAFSLYIPTQVIDDLVQAKAGTTQSGQVVYGICLSSDAEQYTALAESLDPKALADFMNRYYAAVFEPIRRHDGTISDVFGDAALAIWTGPGPDRALRVRACEAACEIIRATERFNLSWGPLRLPTRIGLHSGFTVLGNVGAIDHFEYRAVGDMVNTATRIQGMNKYLGTRVTASEEVVGGLDEFLTRRLGAFLLVGKTQPLVLHELVCRRAEASDEHVCRSGLFAEGLALYEKQSWDGARDRFRRLIDDYGEDAAARLYLQLCDQYREHPPGPSWTAVVRMGTK